MKSRSLAMASMVLGALLLNACAGTQVEDEEGGGEAVVEDLATTPGTAETETQTGAGVETLGLPGAGAIEQDPLSDPNSMLAQRIIYFAFDSAEIAPQHYDLIAAHGAYLADNPQVTVRLEGHADERGSREYNIGLGERRALAVRRLLSLQGGRLEQMPVISYGEERPAAFGHDEASWARNRRVELVYE